jgi:hypothetical protein
MEWLPAASFTVECNTCHSCLAQRAASSSYCTKIAPCSNAFVLFRRRSGYLRRWPDRVPDRQIRCFSRSRSFLDVSQSFAGRMRDERVQ